MLTITHNHEAGTIIDGTSKGDGSADVLKANRWRWGRSIAAWYVPQSRDRRANRHRIEATAAALREAGFEVETVIDDTPRPTAEVEAGKIARQADRVEALEAKADRKSAAADAAWEAAKRDLGRLPEGGEPIKVGHHSEGRHRAAERAETASHTTGARYNPVTVANRIEKIAADIRRAEREIEADRYDPEVGYLPASDELKAARAKRAAPRLAELRDKLEFWEGVRAEQIADRTATGYTREQIQNGDLVKIRGHWREVVRANPKTVSVTTGYSWTDTAPYAEIQEHKRP